MNIAQGINILKIELPTKKNPLEVYFEFFGSANYLDCCHTDSVLKRVGLKAIEGPELYSTSNHNLVRAKVIPLGDKPDPYKVGLLEMKAKIDGLFLLSKGDIRDNDFRFEGEEGGI